MAEDITLNLQSTLTNPTDEFSLEAQGKTFPTRSFSSDEAKLLESQMNEIVAALDSSTLNHITKQRERTLALTAAFAKQTFDEKLFGGLNAGDNEIGFDVLRPGHIRSDPATGNIENDWYFQPGSTGWVDYIGQNNQNQYVFGEDQVSVILGLVDQDVNTELSGVNVDAFGRNVDMLPKDLNDMRLSDNENEQMVQPLPTLIGTENDSAHIRLRYDRDVESQPRLFGFTFGLGTFLNNEDY